MDKFGAMRPWKYEWSPENIRRFWNMLAATPLLRKMSFSRMVSSQLASFVSGQLDKDARILDFGAGDGDFCLAMLKAGYRVAAYEPSDGRCAAFLADVENDSKFLGFAASGQFDCVACFEVLEHLHPEAVGDTMARIAAFLRPGGLLIGSVPCNEDLEAGYCVCPHCAAMYHRWQHMRSFSASGLEHFLQKHGFKVKTIKPADFACSFIFVCEKYGEGNKA